MPAPDVAEDLHFRHSLRASRARRAAVAAERRRKRLTGRGTLVAAMVGFAVATSGALASDAGTGADGSAQQSVGVGADAIAAVQSKLGVASDGIYGPQTRRAVRRFQARMGLAVDGVVGPQTLRALGITAGIPAGAASLNRTPPVAADTSRMAAIAQCESGGDPTAISSDGVYRGKYQFTRASWQAVGGSGDPAAAPESEQDQRASALMAKQGPKAWPVCSQRA